MKKKPIMDGPCDPGNSPKAKKKLKFLLCSVKIAMKINIDQDRQKTDIY